MYDMSDRFNFTNSKAEKFFYFFGSTVLITIVRQAVRFQNYLCCHLNMNF